MSYLQEIVYKLPNTNKKFLKQFLNYLSILGNADDKKITFSQSNNEYIPITTIVFSEIKIPQVSFIFDDSSSIDIDIINTTNEIKQSPHTYKHISLEQFMERIKSYELKYIDHTGFNLPYFNGIHPIILKLRKQLKSKSLYHTFPKHLANESWDFILPGTKEEINKEDEVNYNDNRKPKIEIVSFEKSSTTLIQFDLHLQGKYIEWEKHFPEAIAVSEIKSLWVYIQNDFGIDICFVLNQVHNKDWSYHFAKERIAF